ncbi:universal stress protein [Olivibacter sp. XZL3]|uniref:universal stress protein n=1 Tax=Olivibacter sp. XZL3 TaxID=1735116 RepID=UPI0010658A55|nr:universal stress protein [Olivibacter sp. XZL3]
MNTILIPLDYAAGTQNALQYIASAQHDIPFSRVVLLKSTYTSVFQPIISTAEYLCLDGDTLEAGRQESAEYMDKVTEELVTNAGAQIAVDHALSELPMVRALIQVIKQESPDLLVLGNTLEDQEGFINNNLIELVTVSTIPVLVIPSNAKFRKLTKILLPLDFDELNRLVAFDHPLFTHYGKDLRLHVFSIKKKQRDLTEDYRKLSALLLNFNFSIHYTDEEDILEGILNFAEKEDIDLITSLPGKYSFFKKLTHRSITHAIAHNSTRPVLILKQT